MAMTLSEPHPERPYEETSVLLGDAQFAQAADVGGGRPARARGHGRRAGALRRLRPLRRRPPVQRDRRGRRARRRRTSTVEGYDFAPTFSIWTTIEECLNPPLIWERDRGFFVTAPFSEPEVFDFPEGIGPVECVNVEHEEVVLIPQWVDCRRVTFKYGLGEEFIGVLRTLHLLGLDSTTPLDVRGALGRAARRGGRRAARPGRARRPDARAARARARS